MLMAARRKVAYLLLASLVLLALLSAPVIIPAVYAGDCPSAGASNCP